MEKINDLALGIREYDFPDKLNKIIKDKLTNAEVFDWTNSGIGKNGVNTKVRSSKNYQFDHEDESIQRIKRYIYKCVDDYTRHYSRSYTKNIDMNILRYSAGGQYLYHSDSDYNFYRTISIIIYINPTEYSGGETDFKFLELKVKPEIPKLIVFPSNFIYTHAALPVLEGEKYVIVGWLNDVPKEV